MCWPNHHPVLWDFPQAQFYNPLRDVVILCDSSDSPPGFTLLYLPLEMAACDILSTCIRINGLLYISSSKYRDLKCSGFPNSIVHGPCSSGREMGMFDYDCAYCFASDFWPPSASSWIDSSTLCCWWHHQKWSGMVIYIVKKDSTTRSSIWLPGMFSIWCALWLSPANVNCNCNYVLLDPVQPPFILSTKRYSDIQPNG